LDGIHPGTVYACIILYSISLWKASSLHTIRDGIKDFICPLWWTNGDKISTTIDIKSGKQANIIVFVRRENSDTYFAYQPTSDTDLTPKITGVPKFNKTMEFFVEVSYSYGSQKIKFPVGVVIGYDGNPSFEMPNGSSVF
jgi:hypothetical protein